MYLLAINTCYYREGATGEALKHVLHIISGHETFLKSKNSKFFGASPKIILFHPPSNNKKLQI